jgi:hypothetical protein
MTLQRIVIDLRKEEMILRVLYRSNGDTNPGTGARAREVSNLVREGLQDALRSLRDGDVEMCGTSGFTTREDILSLPRSLREARERAS